jgi:hypothetical protein
MTHVDVSVSDAVRHLESLAAELPAEEYESRLVIAHGRRPHLHVRNLSAGVLAEDVLVEAGWFWYSFAERIAPVTEAAVAAGKVARVLRVVNPD